MHLLSGVDTYEEKIATEPQSGNDKVGKHQKAEPSFACGIVGFPAALAAFMDAHEGFFVGSFTLLLVISTTLLWRSTADLHHAGERQSEAIVKMDRAYLTGGGGIVKKGNRWFLLVDVANYGKTPAFLLGFDVQFGKLKSVQANPTPTYDFSQYPFEDRLKSGDTKNGIKEILVDPADSEVVFGAFSYQDIWQADHTFRFIMSLDFKKGRTWSDLRDVVPKSYTDWT
jgi:hypothetical protein